MRDSRLGSLVRDGIGSITNGTWSASEDNMPKFRMFDTLYTPCKRSGIGDSIGTSTRFTYVKRFMLASNNCTHHALRLSLS